MRVVEVSHKGELEVRRVALDQHNVGKTRLYHQGAPLGRAQPTDELVGRPTYWAWTDVTLHGRTPNGGSARVNRATHTPLNVHIYWWTCWRVEASKDLRDQRTTREVRGSTTS